MDHVLVMNLKDWLECSLQLNWILNFVFHLIRKQQTHNNTKLHSEQFGSILVLVYSRNSFHSCKKEVKNLTDLNVDATQ
jgi:hypothetical protein